MDQKLFEKLKNWRVNQARRENREVYKVVSNSALESIARFLPKDKKEMLGIKGIAERNFQKYGMELLDIVSKYSSEDTEQEEKVEKEIYSVSSYLDLLNSKLADCRVRVKGEISSVDIRNTYLFFDLKDPEDESIISCFMWKSDYDLCGIEIEEGMEIIVYGLPEIYKPGGRFSLRVKTIELVGEGVLKKAYEKLKLKLKKEGLFDIERKKPIPNFPQKIGLITSREGAVIHDFMSNIGSFGFKISFVNSRVEGQLAVKELLEAIKHFKDKDIDVLVIIRGGGSLESLQAFNNEVLVREIANLPFPVISGIGHDKDIPLLSLTADKAVSTPTAATKVLNESWEKALSEISLYEKGILANFSEVLQKTRYNLDGESLKIKESFAHILKKFEQIEQNLKQNFLNLGYSIKNKKSEINNLAQIIVGSFNNQLQKITVLISSTQKTIYDNNPERQLKLGYSIATLKGKVIKSISSVKEEDLIDVKVSDGKLSSKVKKIFK